MLEKHFCQKPFLLQFSSQNRVKRWEQLAVQSNRASAISESDGSYHQWTLFISYAYSFPSFFVNKNKMVAVQEYDCLNLLGRTLGTRIYHFFLFSSERSSWTGAAGIRTHHSLIRLNNRSLVYFLSGISLVNTSRKAKTSKCLIGTNAKTAAIAIKYNTTRSVAWKHKWAQN